MKKHILTAFFLLIGFFAFGQINMADSTVQVITYWEEGETQYYTITKKQIQLKGIDTISVEKASYDVEITVLKETDDSYTIQWQYKNLYSPNPITQKLLDLTSNTKIIYKTDEMGVFIEVENWEEIKNHMEEKANVLKEELKITPEISKAIYHIAESFTTKEAIESVVLKEIQQFHAFHGGKYKLGEILEEQTKVPNIYGNEPFDCYATTCLYEINEENNSSILRATTEIDAEQLLNATLGYLVKIAESINIEYPKREDIGGLKNEMHITSEIHESGWVIFSIRTATVTSDSITNIEELIIEIQ